MDTELKPCPFCGNTPETNNGPTTHWISCESRNCAMNPSTPYCEKWDRALELWNRRDGVLIASHTDKTLEQNDL